MQDPFWDRSVTWDEAKGEGVCKDEICWSLSLESILVDNRMCVDLDACPSDQCFKVSKLTSFTGSLGDFSVGSLCAGLWTLGCVSFHVSPSRTISKFAITFYILWTQALWLLTLDVLGMSLPSESRKSWAVRCGVQNLDSSEKVEGCKFHPDC